MFFLSRAAVELLSPFHFSLLLLIICLLLLLTRRHRFGIVCLLCSLTILFVCGYGVGTKKTVERWESRYPAMTDAKIASLQVKKFSYIVVLGSGHVSDKRLPETSQIGGSSLYRLVEGIRLMHHFTGTKLVISGGIGYDPVANADVVSTVAQDIGVTPDRMIIENRPRNTIQEAKILLPILANRPFLLVTSAIHMRRAMAIFQDLGMNPVPAPTDYILKKSINGPAGDYLPSLGNLLISKRLFYEWIGDKWRIIKTYFSNFQ